MPKILTIIFGIVLLGLITVSAFSFFQKQQEQISCTMEAKICPDGSAVGRSGPNCEFAPCPDARTLEEENDPSTGTTELPENTDIGIPLDRASERVTKKPFGIYIDPKTSPVQPEKFRGYHTGTDFETFPDEASTDVLVRAVCTGPVVMKRVATGYGGMLVQQCVLDSVRVTVIYGHMKLASISVDIGDEREEGDVIGILGTGGSRETDGERKHLHLSIHKGTAIDIRGYVADKQSLSLWLDPCEFFCKK